MVRKSRIFKNPADFFGRHFHSYGNVEVCCTRNEKARESGFMLPFLLQPETKKPAFAGLGRDSALYPGQNLPCYPSHGLLAGVFDCLERLPTVGQAGFQDLNPPAVKRQGHVDALASQPEQCSSRVERSRKGLLDTYPQALHPYSTHSVSRLWAAQRIARRDTVVICIFDPFTNAQSACCASGFLWARCWNAQKKSPLSWALLPGNQPDLVLAQHVAGHGIGAELPVLIPSLAVVHGPSRQ